MVLLCRGLRNPGGGRGPRKNLLKSKGFVRPEIVVWTDGDYRTFRVTRRRARLPTGRNHRYGGTARRCQDRYHRGGRGCELSRVGQQLFVVGMFDDKAVADRVAAAIIQADPSLEIKVAEIAE